MTDEPKKKIFVVDDDQSILDYLKALIQSWGYEFRSCEQGLRAVQKIEEEKPDLILLDVMLADVDGITICRRLRSNPKTASIPVIMCTSLADSTTVYESVIQGAVAFVTKPFELESLKVKIQKALTHPPATSSPK